MSASTQASLAKPESKTEKARNSSSQADKPGLSPRINSQVDQISFLQRTVGNRGVERLLRSRVIQAKPKVGEPSDKFEQETANVTGLRGSGGGPGGPLASAVPLRLSQGGILQRKCSCGGAAGASGECEECSKKKRLGLQTKLKVNDPGDIYEQEANRIADQLMAAPTHSVVSHALPRIQRVTGQPPIKLLRLPLV
jgi:hypothetical protein